MGEKGVEGKKGLGNRKESGRSFKRKTNEILIKFVKTKNPIKGVKKNAKMSEKECENPIKEYLIRCRSEKKCILCWWT